ncbi:hypothetical protein TRVA0_087S00210 [Trichomonascus vanleenenianus]|uniref:uncharacterized protein n=1 Tax=Trichomonascus vanleenenianus TaxID=2268995 RepID=UPI003EC9C760
MTKFLIKGMALLTSMVCAAATYENMNMYEKVGGSIPTIDDGQGEIVYDVAKLFDHFGLTGPVDGLGGKYVFKNLEAQQPVLRNYNTALAEERYDIAIVLYNVLVTGGVVTNDHVTPNSILLKESRGAIPLPNFMNEGPIPQEVSDIFYAFQQSTPLHEL